MQNIVTLFPFVIEISWYMTSLEIFMIQLNSYGKFNLGKDSTILY